mmetsp:Transcript_13065/g.30235  ORF Transcript_13065/g.30235 Transcript_13065/m.30235 type:complete len:146 (-) Transcript_13065:447-884(-)
MSAEGVRGLVGEIFLRLMDQLKSEIAECKERCCGLPFLSICADRWKSESTKDNYLGVVVCFPGKHKKLQARWVSCALFRPTRRQRDDLRSSEIIYLWILCILMYLGAWRTPSRWRAAVASTRSPALSEASELLADDLRSTISCRR